MRSPIKAIISLILIVSLSLTTMLPASAARPGTKFLSDLHMAQARTKEDAKKMLEDNGYTFIDKNLNPGHKHQIYLGYKTSSNVEDAITDISVMNMNGGFNMTNYETALKESKAEYAEMTKNFRIAANEFAANYKAGKSEAKLAYRQLNYYYYDKQVGENTERILMGDYMLNFPETDEEFADILLMGNINILNNIRALLSMGVSSGNMVGRIKEAAKDEAVYKKIEYYELAKGIYSSFKAVFEQRAQAEQDLKDIDNDDTLTEENKIKLSEIPNHTLARVLATEALLETIPYGEDSNYREYIANNTIVDYSAFYPFVEVLTKGQRALTESGQYSSVFIYDQVTLTQDDIDQRLGDIEKDFFEQSVFLGTDMDMFDGSFALTKGAINRENKTGEGWLAESTGDELATILSTYLSIAGAITTAVSIKCLYDAVKTSAQVAEDIDRWTVISDAGSDLDGSFGFQDSNSLFSSEASKTVVDNAAQSQNAMNSASSASGLYLTCCAIGIAVGVAMLGFGIYNIVKILSSYNVEYTDIPTNMIDSVSTENGERYIRYSVVNSFYPNDGEVKVRPGDTNAYNGLQWNAIYYTKNHEAGKCIVASIDTPSSEKDFGSYSPVHPFGQHDVCYNLHAFSRENRDETVFLSFKTSNDKKAAAASVPSVIGSSFAYGMMAVSAVFGLCVGMGLMSFINRKKKEEEQFS